MKIERNTLRLAVAAAALGVGGLSTAYAQTTVPRDITVSANVQSTCRLVNAGNVTFPTVDLLSATAATTASSFEVQCNRGALPTVAFNNGVRNNRTMIGGPNNETLTYRLRQPSALTATDCTDPGADWPTAGVALSSLYTASGGNRVVRLCGEIPTGQAVSAGGYTDTVTMTLSYP
jgi:spore coat protein U-like protein